MGDMRATVKDVAKLAGVSPKTVSNVINGVVFVRPETKARVESALAELDYVPNMSARGLRNGRTGMIALALPDLLRPYSAEVVHLVVELAHERGWGVQIEQTAAEPKREFELLSKARAYLVDGLILNPVNLDDSAVTTAGPLPPLVLIGDVDQDLVSQVAIDQSVHNPGHDHLDVDGLEWEDLMPEINRQTDLSNMFWCLTDLETGAENHKIFWTFTVGDRVKIRLVNELGSDHPMHHPFHIHGAGRFLILARDGEADDNLVWKDTVLIPAGQTVDILLDVTNPGRWMAHCHIAEHIESGMMFSFDVLPTAAPA